MDCPDAVEFCKTKTQALGAVCHGHGAGCQGTAPASRAQSLWVLWVFVLKGYGKVNFLEQCLLHPILLELHSSDGTGVWHTLWPQI